MHSRAGLREVTGGALQSSAEYSVFDDFWMPFSLDARAWYAHGTVAG